MSVANYVNPLINSPDAFPDVQFVLPETGEVCPPWNNGAEKIVADPLAGPFYRLEIDIVNIRIDSKYVFISYDAQLPSGVMVQSYPIFIKTDGYDLVSFLKDVVDEV